MAGVQRFGTLTIDADARRVHLDGHVLGLTKSEYALLLALARRAGRAVGNRELLEAMWGAEWQADTTPLQVHISRLRRKLGESGSAPHYIVTVHGFGYRFEPERPALTPAAVSEEGLAGLGGTDATVDPLYLLATPSHTIQWVSPNVEGVLGWRTQDLEGRSVYDLMVPDDAQARPASRLELDVGQTAAAVGGLRTASGGLWRTEVLVRPVLDEDSEITGFLGEFRPLADVGEQPSTTTVTLSTDRDLILRAIAPQVPVLGWEPEEIIGTRYSPSGLDEAAARALVAALFAAGTRSIRADISALLRDGSRVTVSAATHMEIDDEGQFAGLRTILHLPVADTRSATS